MALPLLALTLRRPMALQLAGSKRRGWHVHHVRCRTGAALAHMTHADACRTLETLFSHTQRLQQSFCRLCRTTTNIAKLLPDVLMYTTMSTQRIQE